MSAEFDEPPRPRGPATPEDVQRAWDALGANDHTRLHEVAKLLLRGTSYKDAGALVMEAFCSAWLAAATVAARREQQGRAWPPEVPFMAYMIMTIRGLASDSRGSWHARMLVSAGNEPYDAVTDGADLLQQWLAVEQQDRERQALAELRAHPGIGWLVEALLEGLKPAAIKAKYGRTGRQLHSAQRTLRRLLARFRQEGTP
jgi:hypothetical protein